jgi:transcriptional regulator with XRE-family HTH domain
VLSRKIRDERERLGITQVRLAQTSGVARSQLAAFEAGANVSVATLEKILGEISTLRLDVVPADLDLEQARRAAAELERYAAQMQAAAARLLAALGGAPAPAGLRPGGAGAELYADDDAPDVSPQQRAELGRLVEQIQKKKA